DAETVELGALGLEKMTSGWRRPLRDRSIEDRPLSIGGSAHEKGVGAHADSVGWGDLHGDATRFRAMVGVDDEMGEKGTVAFYVYADGESLFESGTMKGGETARAVDVDLRGKQRLALIVTSAADGAEDDHADWAEARITFDGQAPTA